MSHRSLKLFWCSTDENSSCGCANCEDWFMVALNSRQAASLHDDFEGFEPGDAKAKFVADIPAEWQGLCMECKQPWPQELLEGKKRLSADTLCSGCSAHLIGWPCDEILKACGAKIIDDDPDNDTTVILNGRKYRMGAMEVAVNRRRDDDLDSKGLGRRNGTTASRLLN